jgi:hypothetical protein
MKAFFFCIALFVGQLQTSQAQDVLRLLPPHASSIPVTAAGKVVELLHAPPVVHLPHPAPKPDQQGNAWYVDVKNLGPNDVTIEEATEPAQPGSEFALLLHAKNVARIRAVGSRYVLIKLY